MMAHAGDSKTPDMSTDKEARLKTYPAGQRAKGSFAEATEGLTLISKQTNKQTNEEETELRPTTLRPIANVHPI